MLPWSSSIHAWPTPPQPSPTASSPAAPTTWPRSRSAHFSYSASSYPTSDSPVHSANTYFASGHSEHLFVQPSELQLHWTHSNYADSDIPSYGSSSIKHILFRSCHIRFRHIKHQTHVLVYFYVKNEPSCTCNALFTLYFLK